MAAPGTAAFDLKQQRRARKRARRGEAAQIIGGIGALGAGLLGGMARREDRQFNRGMAIQQMGQQERQQGALESYRQADLDLRRDALGIKQREVQGKASLEQARMQRESLVGALSSGLSDAQSPEDLEKNWAQVRKAMRTPKAKKFGLGGQDHKALVDAYQGAQKAQGWDGPSVTARRQSLRSEQNQLSSDRAQLSNMLRTDSSTEQLQALSSLAEKSLLASVVSPELSEQIDQELSTAAQAIAEGNTGTANDARNRAVRTFRLGVGRRELQNRMASLDKYALPRASKNLKEAAADLWGASVTWENGQQGSDIKPHADRFYKALKRQGLATSVEDVSEGLFGTTVAPGDDAPQEQAAFWRKIVEEVLLADPSVSPDTFE